MQRKCEHWCLVPVSWLRNSYLCSIQWKTQRELGFIICTSAINLCQVIPFFLLTSCLSIPLSSHCSMWPWRRHMGEPAFGASSRNCICSWSCAWRDRDHPCFGLTGMRTLEAQYLGLRADAVDYAVHMACLPIFCRGSGCSRWYECVDH